MKRPKVISFAVQLADMSEIHLRLLRFGKPIMPYMSEIHELAALVRWREGSADCIFSEAPRG